MSEEVMVELNVMFDNTEIPTYVLLTGPFDPWADPVDSLHGTTELRATAEDELGPLMDEQCFYRFFRREVDQ